MKRLKNHKVFFAKIQFWQNNLPAGASSAGASAGASSAGGASGACSSSPIKSSFIYEVKTAGSWYNKKRISAGFTIGKVACYR